MSIRVDRHQIAEDLAETYLVEGKNNGIEGRINSGDSHETSIRDIRFPF